MSPDIHSVDEGLSARRIRAVIEYDGTDFCGFQVQARGRTIQGEIEQALARVTGRTVRVVGAGRTDAGVHASGQVVHATVTWRHDLAQLKRALNAVLPGDVAVRDVEYAPPGFHSRFSAQSRVYAYHIWNDEVPSPLHRRYSYCFDRYLDDLSMSQACGALIGTHDFLPFGWAPQGDNTVRTVLEATCVRSGRSVVIEIEADAFLRRMVRRIVANLMLVGLGKLSVEDFGRLLLLRDRRTPASEAPSQGLCLLKVNY